MKTTTTIIIKDGFYGNEARLEIVIELPCKVSTIMQKELNTGIDNILKVYQFYKPAAVKK